MLSAIANIDRAGKAAVRSLKARTEPPQMKMKVYTFTEPNSGQAAERKLLELWPVPVTLTMPDPEGLLEFPLWLGSNGQLVAFYRLMVVPGHGVRGRQEYVLACLSKNQLGQLPEDKQQVIIDHLHSVAISLRAQSSRSQRSSYSMGRQ